MRCAARSAQNRQRRLAAKRRGVARDQDSAVAGLHHRGREAAREVKQAHGIDLEIAVQHLRVDLHERAAGAAHRIVDQHRRLAHLLAHRSDRRIELRLVGDVASKGLGVGDLVLERRRRWRSRANRATR
jgi:hypothetical protein